jgi:hypothetical protein
MINERWKLSVDDVRFKVERAGRRFTTRLVDRTDPYGLLGR